MWRRIGKRTLYDGTAGWIHRTERDDGMVYCAYLGNQFLGCWTSLDRAKKVIEDAYN